MTATPQQLGGDAERHFGDAMERARAGELDLASELFREASDRGHAGAALMLGTLYQEGGRLPDAEAQYRRALAGGDLDESLLAQAELSLGFIRAQLGDDRQAEQFYRSAAARGDVEAMFNLGNLLRRTGRDAEAETAYRQAAEAGLADAAYNLAEILGERGALEEAETLLRQAIAGGVGEAVGNLAKIRLALGDAAEAETLMRQAVDAGDENAIFNLGVILQVRGDLEEAEMWMRRAQAAGHPEAAEHLARLSAARGATMEPVAEGSALKGELSALFSKTTSKKDRLQALKGFASTSRERLRDLSTAAGKGVETANARGAALLAEVAAKLPIRTGEVLRRDYGSDPEVTAQHVIDDAAWLAGWLWTAAAAIPGPPTVVHPVKVVLHCAIEIRMVGELYTLHQETETPRDSAWLAAVLSSWANRHPVKIGGTLTSGALDVTGQLRVSFTGLIGNQSRLAGITSRGSEGKQTVRHLGSRLHRRMRPHPTTWAEPGTQTLTGLAARSAAAQLQPGSQALAGLAAAKVAERIRPGSSTLAGLAARKVAEQIQPASQALAGLAAKKLAEKLDPTPPPPTSATPASPPIPATPATPLARAIPGQRQHRPSTALGAGNSTSPTTAESVPDPAAAVDGAGQPPTDPRAELAQAWALHSQAQAHAEGIAAGDPVADRLRYALGAQQTHLERLGKRLGAGRTGPSPSAATDLELASRLLSQAEDAIDRVEQAGTRPRRLASWGPRRRNALVYALTATVVSAPGVAMLWGASWQAALALVALQCLVLPWLSLAVGSIAVGRLFRPWLGGPVPRSPIIGTLTVLTVHIALSALTASLNALL